MGKEEFRVLLIAGVFMAGVGALPSEEERRHMTMGEFAYAWLYRFLQNVCMNVRWLNPRLAQMQDELQNPRKHDEIDSGVRSSAAPGDARSPSR